MIWFLLRHTRWLQFLWCRDFDALLDWFVSAIILIFWLQVACFLIVHWWGVMYGSSSPAENAKAWWFSHPLLSWMGTFLRVRRTFLWWYSYSIECWAFLSPCPLLESPGPMNGAYGEIGLISFFDSEEEKWWSARIIKASQISSESCMGYLSWTINLDLRFLFCYLLPSIELTSILHWLLVSQCTFEDGPGKILHAKMPPN